MIRTIINRLRKLEVGPRARVETEAGRRAREMSETLRRRLAAADARMKARGYEMPKIAKSEREDLSRLTFGQILRHKIARDITKRQMDGPVTKVASDEDDHKSG